ncbi:MAG: glycogen debranching enzyme, partial [Candidatus Heimdallarchaeota archaeon]|nr:glycogen debranching enzyme [Candidatus Heimdallarchaeota archaeon]
TQNGNNNAYCQDNEISWIDWELADKNSDFLRFVKLLIQFRKIHPSVVNECLPNGGKEIKFPVLWHGVKLNQPDWSYESRTIAWQLTEYFDNNLVDIYIAANSFWKPLKFVLPKLDKKRKWHRFMDSSLDSPNDISDLNNEEKLIFQKSYKTDSRSMIVLVGR